MIVNCKIKEIENDCVIWSNVSKVFREMCETIDLLSSVKFLDSKFAQKTRQVAEFSEDFTTAISGISKSERKNICE